MKQLSKEKLDELKENILSLQKQQGEMFDSFCEDYGVTGDPKDYLFDFAYNNLWTAENIIEGKFKP